LFSNGVSTLESSDAEYTDPLVRSFSWYLVPVSGPADGAGHAGQAGVVGPPVPGVGGGDMGVDVPVPGCRKIVVVPGGGRIHVGYLLIPVDHPLGISLRIGLSLALPQAVTVWVSGVLLGVTVVPVVGPWHGSTVVGCHNGDGRLDVLCGSHPLLVIDLRVPVVIPVDHPLGISLRIGLCLAFPQSSGDLWVVSLWVVPDVGIYTSGLIHHPLRWVDRLLAVPVVVPVDHPLGISLWLSQSDCHKGEEGNKFQHVVFGLLPSK